MKEKYGLYIIDPDDVEGDISTLSYDEIKKIANESILENDFKEILQYLVESLNYDTVSDQHFFYVTDEENETILFGR